jgi:hypothetical protein
MSDRLPLLLLVLPFLFAAGLQSAVDLIEPIKQRHPSVSYADLYQMASAVAVEVRAVEDGRGWSAPGGGGKMMSTAALCVSAKSEVVRCCLVHQCQV